MSAGEISAGLLPMSDETRRHAIKEDMEQLRLKAGEVAAGAQVGEKTLRRLLAGEGKTNEATFKAVEGYLAQQKARWTSGSFGNATPTRPLTEVVVEPPRPEPQHVVVQFEGVSTASLQIKKITVDAAPEELSGAIAAVQHLFDQARRDAAIDDD